MSNPVIYLVTNTRFRRFVVNSITGVFTGQNKRTISSAVFSSAMLTTAAVVVSASRSKVVEESAGKIVLGKNLKKTPIIECIDEVVEAET